MNDLPAWLRSYIGIPFKPDGLDRRGCHCWGLVRMVLAEQAGLKLPAYAETSADDLLAARRLMGLAAIGPDWIKVDMSFRLFDCVLMTAMSRNARVAGHVGVMISPSRMLHVWEETNAMHVAIDHHQIRTKVVGIYRHRTLA